MYILDSDHLSILEWRGSETERLANRLAEVEPADLATTIINYEEQTRGWIAFVAQAKTLPQQVAAYARLERHLNLYRTIPVLGFSDVAAANFSELRRQYRRIGAMDLKIAAIVLSHNATLLTRNSADFGQIDGLRIENWTH
ncbi:MAG: type II toxin-antitoxin system VapC family toxin [Pirellulales bacterium]